MPEFGTLKPVELRKIWPNEASNFTPWLAESIESLGEALGMELELMETEADVGDFSLDLLAKDLGTGRKVVIENQITQTDHDHLGKLLTYAAGFDAGAVVWVAKSIRDEHRQTLEWLNQRTSSDTNFFGVAIEVFQIDESKPAFKFVPVVYPNEWKKDGVTPPLSSRSEAYKHFFQKLIDELRDVHKFTAAKVGQPQNWYSFSSGVSGIPYSASFSQGGRFRVEAYIDLGDGTQNKALFDKLLTCRKEIEAALGETMEWERMDNRRASRIAIYSPGSIQSSPEELENIRKMMIDRLLRLKNVLGPYLQKFTSPTSAVGGAI